MYNKPNKVCKVCGESYYYCPTCGRPSALEKYKTMFCSKNCRDIFHTLSRYSVNHITKEETQKALSTLDLSKRAQFNEQIKVDIDEVMKVEKPKIIKKEESESVVVK